MNEIIFQKPIRKISKVFIHCSASDHAAHDDISVIRKWHLDRGWSDVGYHYFIKKNGDLQLGRDLERTPAAQRGFNLWSIAICVHGLEKNLFTVEQFETLKSLCGLIKVAYNNEVTFHGHCEVSSKTCPVFDYKQVLNLDEFGYMV